jgi:predicted kinase
MRQLYLMRGNIGSGKSTWLRNNGLEPYTLSADAIRLMVESPILNVDGELSISQINDKKVWGLLFDMMETRMQRGELIFIDAVHSKPSSFSPYKKYAEKYRYRIFCVDFSSVPLEICKLQNMQREKYKQVPEVAIDNIDSRLKTMPVPSYATIINPLDFLDKFHIKPLDFTGQYKNIKIIGDIHASYDVLRKIVSDINDDTLYIFIGDYLDRGKQNVEVMKFLMEIYEKPNVYLLEGNHERWIRYWANEDYLSIRSNEFLFLTIKQLQAANLDLGQIRQVCRKFAQMAYFNFYDRTFLVNHGGISAFPFQLASIASEAFIKGVGKYEDMLRVADSWEKSNQGIYQVCGHRNITNEPIKVRPHFYCLEAKVEFGGFLRYLDITDKTILECEERNTFFVAEEHSEIKELDSPVFLLELRATKGIKEKPYGPISSFNFSRDIFYKKAWNNMTTKARGLFINTRTNEIVARSYDKFFNINERLETKLETIDFVFPVSVYEKYNGFLGILGYDSESDSILFCTKSVPQEGIYVNWFKLLFNQNYPDINWDQLKFFLRDNKVSMVFEVIDIDNDPHIIEYRRSSVILLDIIHRNMVFGKYLYIQVQSVAKDLGLTVKREVSILQNRRDFVNWYEVEKDVERSDIEGYVLEDVSGFMVKFKGPYYTFWKHMRSITEAVRHRHNIRLGSITTPLGNNFYAWLKNQSEVILEQDIITLRKNFESTKCQL